MSRRWSCRWFAITLFGHRRGLTSSLAVGAPVVLEYDTSRASIYPRDGMFLSATAIYRRVHNQPHLSFIADDNSITLGRSIYPLVDRQSRGRLQCSCAGRGAWRRAG